jgi:dTDP-4-amino-4,6-dideoxygalactose transaminase
MLRVKLAHLEAETLHRRAIVQVYVDQITHADVQLPVLRGTDVAGLESHVWHLFVVRTQRRGALQQYLLTQGVQTLIHYPIPPHKQDAYRDWNDVSLPLTEALHEQVLSLPLSPVMTLEQAREVARAVNSF